MRKTYEEALETLPGTSVEVSVGGGRSRYVTWALEGSTIIGRIYGRTIARLSPSEITLTCAGHNTATTTDALGYIAGHLGLPMGWGLGTTRGVLMMNDEPMALVENFTWDGKRLTPPDAPLAPIRGVWDMVENEDGLTVWTEGRAGKGVARAAAERHYGSKVRLRWSNPGSYTFTKIGA